MPMSWYDAGTWKTTQKLWVYNGTQWKEVVECYIWNGSTWKLCHVTPTSLDSITITDTSCSPTLGNFSFAWTYTSSVINLYEMYLDYSFDGGSSYTQYGLAIDPTTSPFTGSLDGVAGFTSLDNTTFRARLVTIADNNVQATGSPKVASPPFSC